MRTIMNGANYQRKIFAKFRSVYRWSQARIQIFFKWAEVDEEIQCKGEILKKTNHDTNHDMIIHPINVY